MRTRVPRFGIRRPVQFYRVDELVRAFTDDLSQRGAFVHTDAWLPINGVVDLRLLLSEHEALVVPARVAYCLPPDQALALGRRPGIGFQFLSSSQRRLEPLEAYVRSASRTDLRARTQSSFELRAPRPSPPASGLRKNRARVLLACTSQRLRRRLLHALSNGPFELSTASTDVELYARARAEPWDVIVVDGSIDAARWLSSLIRPVRSGQSAVLFLSGDQSHLPRTEAGRIGASDFLPLPFSDDELCMRVEQLAFERDCALDADIAGDLSRMPLSSVLTLLELEHRSGRLLLSDGEQRLEVGLCAGAIATINGLSTSDARAQLLEALQWTRGRFEFYSAEIAAGTSEAWPISFALLQAAKLADERGADHIRGELSPRRRLSTPV